MTDEFKDEAPKGYRWFCMMCGKTAPALSSEVGGWDESCSMNAVLIDRFSTGPSHEQEFEFSRQREASISQGFARIDALIASIKNREPIDPELLALAAASLENRE